MRLLPQGAVFHGLCLGKGQVPEALRQKKEPLHGQRIIKLRHGSDVLLAQAGLLLAQLWQHLGKEGGGLGGWVAILHRVAPECPSNLADVLRWLAVIAPQEPAHAPLHKFGGEQGIKGGRPTQIDPGVVKGRKIAPQMAFHGFDTLRSERLWQA